MDSIDFRAECRTRIDFNNESCSWGIAEGNFNTVPIHGAKLLCIIYFEGTIDSEGIDLINLFDDAKIRLKYLDQIQFIFIYEPESGFTGSYQKKEEIASILKYNLRIGFQDED